MRNSSHTLLLRAITIFAYTFIVIFCGIPILLLLKKTINIEYILDGNIFSGLKNYSLVLKDNVFWKAVINSAIIMLHIPLLIIFSLCTAVFLRNNSLFSRICKMIIIIPELIASLTIAGIFASVFGYYGPINKMIESTGLPPIYWLGNITTAFFVIIICIIYSSFGWQTFIFSSAMTTVPSEIDDLIVLDGVKRIKKVKVYFHLIKSTIGYSIILNIIYSFSGFFATIYTLTKGGPGYNTTTIDYLIYLRAFKNYRNISNAYAIAILLLIVVMILVKVLFNIFLKKDKKNERFNRKDI